ncbi:hypothetical protein Bhyg_12363, partial [Pseudolycoriella hygida]
MTDDGHNRTPRALDCVNVATEWPKWKQNFTVWMIANDKYTKSEKDQIATFIWLLGEQGMTIYNSLYPNNGSQISMLGIDVPAPTSENPAATRQRTLAEVLDKFDTYCVPQKNVAMESYKFNMIFQKEHQSFNKFETALRKQIQYCDYKCSSPNCQQKFDDRMLRDRIIVGVHDKKLQLKLLDGRNEALADVIDKCKIFEAANKHKHILDEKSPIVASIASECHTNIAFDRKAGVDVLSQSKRICFNCGHSWDKEHLLICKAKEAVCRKCSKKGHFAVMCRHIVKKQQPILRKDDKSMNSKQSVGTLSWSGIAGLGTCVKLGIIKQIDVNQIVLPASTESFVEQYKDVFTRFARFIPNWSKMSAKLRYLTRHDVDFQWTNEHELEFCNLLAVVSSEPVLAILVWGQIMFDIRGKPFKKLGKHKASAVARDFL